MDREPHGRRVFTRPDHAMTAMGGDEQPVAFRKRPVLGLALDAQTCGAGDEKHKLVACLVVPLVFGRRLTGRDDALDTHARALDENLENLIRNGLRR